MDIIAYIFDNHFITLIGLSGLTSIGFALYWIVNKGAKEQQLARLREQYESMRPTDPEYNQVKLLYTAMMIDAQGYSHSEFVSGSAGGDSSTSDGASESGNEGDHS